MVVNEDQKDGVDQYPKEHEPITKRRLDVVLAPDDDAINYKESRDHNPIDILYRIRVDPVIESGIRVIHRRQKS
jgi:hypothetical protein